MVLTDAHTPRGVRGAGDAGVGEMVMGVGERLRLRLRLRLFRFSALQHGGKCSESLAAWKHFSRSAAAAAVSRLVQKVPTGGGCN